MKNAFKYVVIAGLLVAGFLIYRKLRQQMTVNVIQADDASGIFDS